MTQQQVICSGDANDDGSFGTPISLIFRQEPGHQKCQQTDLTANGGVLTNVTNKLLTSQ